MAEILFINACVRPGSRTLELAEYTLDKLSGEIERVDLFNTPISHLDLEAMKKRTKACDALDFSSPAFDLAKQFARAETIVIAAPYWDLMFPAVLKTYLENISVVGITFKYLQSGIPVGLCKANDLYFITTAGGFIGENNYGFSYLKALSQSLFGISKVHCFTAEGLDISEENVKIFMQEAKEKIDLAFADHR